MLGDGATDTNPFRLRHVEAASTERCRFPRDCQTGFGKRRLHLCWREQRKRMSLAPSLDPGRSSYQVLELHSRDCVFNERASLNAR